MYKKEKNLVKLKEESENNNILDLEPSRNLAQKRVISFDVYFQGLMSSKKGILPHHKAPMRQYAESYGLKEGTEEEFNTIFKLY